MASGSAWQGVAASPSDVDYQAMDHSTTASFAAGGVPVAATGANVRYSAYSEAFDAAGGTYEVPVEQEAAGTSQA